MNMLTETDELHPEDMMVQLRRKRPNEKLNKLLAEFKASGTSDNIQNYVSELTRQHDEELLDL